jgi:DNA-binding NtrC family response regulator
LLKQQRILIVDDDPRVLFILRTTLERIEDEYQIQVAHGGREALGKVEEEPFDLVITDVRMPGIDGIELVKAIRALKLNTAVIWITAYGCYRLQEEGKQLSVYCCLDKPLRIGEIRKAAQEALRPGHGPGKTGV